MASREDAPDRENSSGTLSLVPRNRSLSAPPPRYAPKIIHDGKGKYCAQAPTESIIDITSGGPGYPEYQPNCTNIVRGGFGVINENVRPGPIALRAFPPPNNAAYENALKGHGIKHIDHAKVQAKNYPKFVSQTTIRRSEHIVLGEQNRKTVVGHAKSRKPAHELLLSITEAVEDTSSTSDSSTILTPSSSTEANEKTEEKAGEEAKNPNLHMEPHSEGEKLARTINFQRTPWVTTTPGVSGEIYTAEEQRKDFVDNVNKSGSQLGYCSKCMKRHIPPGPPITLADRDTCGADLPEWFPSHLVDKPWDTFTAMMNELIELEELTADPIKGDPNKPPWDFEYHDADEKWAAVGRREGWWKCRSGPEAPMVEQTCTLCHSMTREKVPTAGETRKALEDRKKFLQDFIDSQSRAVGERDKEIALELMRTRGFSYFRRLEPTDGEVPPDDSDSGKSIVCSESSSISTFFL